MNYVYIIAVFKVLRHTSLMINSSLRKTLHNTTGLTSTWECRNSWNVVLALSDPTTHVKILFPIKDVYQAGCYIFNSNAFNCVPLLSTPAPVTSVSKSQGVEGPSRVMKKTIQLPVEQPSDVDKLLKQLRALKVGDTSYMAMYFQILA